MEILISLVLKWEIPQKWVFYQILDLLAVDFQVLALPYGIYWHRCPRVLLNFVPGLAIGAHLNRLCLFRTHPSRFGTPEELCMLALN